MTHFALMAAVMVAAVPLPSCDPTLAKHPLSTPGPPDARLTGTWVGQIGETPSILDIRPRKDGRSDLVVLGLTENEGDAVLSYDAFSSSVGGKTYLNLREKKYTNMLNNEFELAPNYIFIRYELRGEELSLAYLRNEGSKKAVEAGAIHGGGSGELVLSDESAVLASWVNKADLAVFSPIGTFRKQKLDWPKVASPTTRP